MYYTNLWMMAHFSQMVTPKLIDTQLHTQTHTRTHTIVMAMIIMMLLMIIMMSSRSPDGRGSALCADAVVGVIEEESQRLVARSIANLALLRLPKHLRRPQRERSSRYTTRTALQSRDPLHQLVIVLRLHQHHNAP